ncbi:septation protein IspZ [Labilibacter marinus]|uniref:septation protein IspZ n=1 Tax=Labilibacter marinus TaxID=1477105 RepID=UPI00094F75D2|nr:septation protein IspZ [Labilibacter marinus]
MNIVDLIKKLLPGLAPLIIFVIADSIWGTEVGLIVAIGFGLVEIFYSLIRKQKPDKFILFDVGLLVAMGGVSLLLDNDLFFKLKPGVIGAILCVLLGVSAYGKTNIMMAMSGRYLKDVDINPWQQYEMLQSIKALFWIFSGHTVLVIISAVAMSKEAWVTISGPGFYILFGAYFVFELYKKKKVQSKYQEEEWLPIVDDEGAVLGKMPRSVAHKKSMILHPVVHIQVFNAKGELYLQKRAENKLVQPGKWDTAVGGHVSAEESIELSLQREASEEIGLTDFKAQPFQRYKWESSIEKELVFAFICTTDQALKPDPAEVSEGRYWTMDEIEAYIGKEIFTPNFEHEFELLKAYLKG